jgi:hypothetical protein
VERDRAIDAHGQAITCGEVVNAVTDDHLDVARQQPDLLFDK